MVQDIEKLGSETKRGIFGDAKPALNRNVGLRRSESAQHITSEIALLTGGGRDEGRSIEDPAARISLAKEFERGSRIEIRTGIQGDAGGTESPSEDINRKTRSRQAESAQGPAANDRPADRIASRNR